MAKAYFVNEWLIRQLDDLTDKVIGSRKRLHKSQQDIADVLGKSRQQYTNDERNIGNMRLKEVLQVLHELGYEVEVKRE